MGDMVGRNFGPYRILDQVGAGGMATVYKAYHATMDRYVAIKVLPQHLARDPNFRARFQREARTIARLEHRYILPVHDVGEEDGIPYFVMRYTDSGDLNDLIRRKSLSVARIAALVGQVAEALAYAHRQGIIHRDVKPANILISREGDPLLTDFGIAKIYEETLQLTSDGMMVGTPTYMAPEQLQGQPVDARTDIYALGVVLYQTLTGEPPFVAETPLAVALMHMYNPLRPPRQLNPNIPESIERIILRAMAKDPSDRFQTASEMAEALHQALTELSRLTTVLPTAAAEATSDAPTGVATPPATPQPAPPPQPAAGAPRRPRWLWAALGGLAVVALVAALLTIPRVGQSGSTGATPGPAASAAAPAATANSLAALPPGPTVTPRAGLRVFGSTAGTIGLVTLGDAVWGATSGGLVRFAPDGQRRVFTTADGLPFNKANALVAAPDGALWLASYQGIVRVRPTADGLGEVRFYNDADGLDIGQGQALMVDADGSIWAGGASYAPHHISHLEGGRWKGLDLPASDPALKDVHVEVVSLMRSRDGALWVGLYDDGILRQDAKGWTHFGAAQGLGKASIRQILEDQSGTIWAAEGETGLLRFDPRAGSWQHVPIGTDNQSIYAIAQIGASLYASGGRFVARSDDSGVTWTPIASSDDNLGDYVNAIATDPGGQLWVGSEEGVSIFTGGQWRRLRPTGELPMNSVGSLAQAPDGKLWAIEEYGGTAGIVDPASLAIEPITLPDARIQAVAFSGDTIWLGTSAGIVRQRGGAQLRITTADGLPSDNIRSLLAVDTTLWIGTANGLAIYDLAAEKVVGAVPDFAGGIITALFHAPDGAVWAGSIKENDAGKLALGRYDGKAWQAWKPGDQPLPENSSGVVNISADSQGRVWVAVWNGGIYTWDGTAWRSWSEGDGAPGGNIQALVPLDGALWMGGHASGLFRWNKDGWRLFKVGGLSSDVIDMRFTADGALWLATGDGLLRISKEGVAALK
jgi:ligand-binding sensor domain-containing protein/tRNA A-37 threonylcarbamoyl transferase component Bud32